jgi:hypothetical protein
MLFRKVNGGIWREREVDGSSARRELTIYG